jgi:hypothetical protein
VTWRNGGAAMARVVLEDEKIVAALDALKHYSVLCDKAGRVLGYYFPYDPKRPLSIRGMKSPLSNEERDRIIREELDDARPLSEFWEKMRTKYPDKFAEPN